MLKKFLIFFVLTLFIFFGKSYAQNNLKTQFEIFYAPEKYPQTATFYDKDGNPILLSDFKGKVVVLNFWKATCRTCLIELPSLSALAKKYPDIVVLAISEGEETPDLVEKIKLINNAVSNRELNEMILLCDSNKSTELILKSLENGDAISAIKITQKAKVSNAEDAALKILNDRTMSNILKRKKLDELFGIEKSNKFIA